MTVIIPVLCVLITIGVIELLSLNNLKRVFYRYEVNMSLVEPDEVAVLTYRVYNTSRWPVMFVSFSFLFGDNIEVRESDEWKAQYGGSNAMRNMYGRELFLLPHRSVRGTISFSLKKRGVYRNCGRIYLETGDFLGLKTDVASYDLTLDMVCTAKLAKNSPDIRLIGGLLGEVTARRFICEDPSLVIGFREYTGREPLKDVSWTQTAKSGMLMVKNHDFTMDCDVAVIADIELASDRDVERCLSLTRTACEYLEDLRVPYSLLSNGDLFETQKGSGRKHLFAIQRRIGESHFTKYKELEDLIGIYLGTGSASRGYIVIMPKHDMWIEYCISQLAARSGAAICILTCEEEAA